MPESLSPVDGRIFHESIENILSGLDQGIKRAILLIAVCVPDAETWEQNETLKHSQQPVHTVAPACDGKCVTLGHFDQCKNRTYVLHGCCHIVFFEKNLGYPRENVILCIDMVLSMFFGGT